MLLGHLDYVLMELSNRLSNKKSGIFNTWFIFCVEA